jgi:hypothetical protein
MRRAAREGAPVSQSRGARRRLIGQISDWLFRDLEATVLAARGVLKPPAGRPETRPDSPPPTRSIEFHREFGCREPAKRLVPGGGIRSGSTLS